MLKVPTAVNSCINEDLQFLEEIVVIKWEGVQGAARGEKLIWEGLQAETEYIGCLCPLLLTWVNFNLNMDK